jgi:hypothetical protein
MTTSVDPLLPAGRSEPMPATPASAALRMVSHKFESVSDTVTQEPSSGFGRFGPLSALGRREILTTRAKCPPGVELQRFGGFLSDSERG